ncbi:hypothetical protein F2Q70_00004791 [Brassica cretica]|uniref:Uncharacterized protein n=1 Tax=Brassica cretica TaxID=69181 RepID=A0A3N6PL80_BRACR|nr:hypothetical protein F2Q70_00004791 [Brassica cretica]KAF3563343.1 hypothetical protein DY000_02016540 [Brassica cretica]
MGHEEFKPTANTRAPDGDFEDPEIAERLLASREQFVIRRDKCKLIKCPIIAEVMLEKIKKELEMSAPMIREEFRNKFNILISHEQAKIARRIVLDKLQAECNEHFQRLRNYEMDPMF